MAGLRTGPARFLLDRIVAQRLLRSLLRNRADRRQASVSARAFVPRLARGGDTAEPEALLTQVELLLDRLRQPQAEIGSPDLLGFSVDPETFLEALGSDYEELQAVVDELNGERRKSSQTLIAKNETSDRYDHLFAPIANALQVFYVLAGMDELARRIRPSTRRPGRRQEVADETLSWDDEPGDAEEATAAGAESETGAAIAA